MARKCQKCGGVVGEGDLYCIHCGTPLERAMQESVQNEDGNAGTRREEEAAPELAKPLGFREYLLIGVLLCLPVVNIILAIIWATGGKENPNRRNLARAWLVFAAVGAVAGVIFFVGLLRAMQLDELAYPEYDYYEDEWEDYDNWKDWEDWEDWDDYEYDYDYDHGPGHHWEREWEI